MEFNLPIHTFSFLYIIEKEASGKNIANKIIIVSNAEKVVGSVSIRRIAICSKNAFLYKTTPQILRTVIIHYASKTSNEA